MNIMFYNAHQAREDTDKAVVELAKQIEPQERRCYEKDLKDVLKRIKYNAKHGDSRCVFDRAAYFVHHRFGHFIDTTELVSITLENLGFNVVTNKRSDYFEGQVTELVVSW